MDLNNYNHLNIDLDLLKDNVNIIVNTYNEYKYYFGVVKANGYNHGDIEISKTIIENGINYLAVSSIEEALRIRKEIKDIDILILMPINIRDVSIASKNNITITIHSLEYYNKLIRENINIKVHIKIDSGMNRLGIKNGKDLEQIINTNEKYKNIVLEGIYTHFSNSDSNDNSFYNKQIENFKNITKNINLNKFKIIHLGNSSALINHNKIGFANGIRIGLIMYGLSNIKTKLNIHPIMSLYSKVIQVKEVNKGEYVGYDINYIAKKNETIAIVPIGYADGINRKNTGRNVLINNKQYKIIGNICMDMLMVKVDNTINIDDKVTIIGENIDCNYIAKHLNTINYEVICSITNRVKKVYKKSL